VSFDSLKFDIIPYNANITRNSYREADTASVTIPYKALPLDPRILRACAIHIFCGSLDPSSYAKGMGPIGGSSPSRGRGKLSVIPDTGTKATTLDFNGTPGIPTNEVFRGFVDTIEIEQDGDDTITLECRDITSIFLGEEVQTQGLAGIPRDLPLDIAISQIIIGEATAQTLPRPPPLKWSVADRQTFRGQRRQLTMAIACVDARISVLNIKLGFATNPAVIAGITEEIATLTAQNVVRQTALAAASISESTAEALPLLAQRFGVPGARGMRVVNETRFFPVMPTLAEIKGVKWFDSKGVTKKSSSAGSREKINYWDLITDLCVASGFICYIRPPKAALPGFVTPPPELVITDPRTYYGDQLPGGIPNPNAQIPPGLAKNLHEFAYGSNVNSIQMKRTVQGKGKPTAIQVNAHTSEKGRLLSVRFPPTDLDPTGATPAPANSVAPSQIGDKEDVQTMLYKGTIPEIRGEEILGVIAEKIYEEISRGEFNVTIRTKQMMCRPQNVLQESKTGEIVADIFELQAGDSIRIGRTSVTSKEIEQAQITQAGIFQAMGFGERISLFIETGFSVLAAVQAAEAYENAQFPEVFRVTTVGIDFDHNEGFDFEIQAVNYLDVRNSLSVVGGLPFDTAPIP
jgi:hypothetical protein